MPHRKPESVSLPLAVTTMITCWGIMLRQHRIRRSITMNDMKRRLDVSLVTLQRMERGEPSVQVSTYLNAMVVLGLLNDLCPAPSPVDLQGSRQRARVEKGDPDYF